MSTVTSADGTTIDYDAYGSGPAVILIGGASQHRAIDPRTTEIAQHLGGRASRRSTMTGAAVAAQATPHPVPAASRYRDACRHDMCGDLGHHWAV
jgi:hypothetical protein